MEQEQQHVDRVHAELVKATRRAEAVQAEGLSRGRTDRTGDIRDEEMAGLFERDALVYSAGRRRASLESQYEGLVFGRLDLEHTTAREGTAREVRYVGRLGVRDDDYEPLVVDWRAPAASPFYRATPVDPQGVIRRRVLRCRGARVLGVEDDLMVPEPPEDMVVVGDGALMAALTRSRGAQMRDIVATIQAHQDEAIRAPWKGVTEITGGPGTGKTVVALHRAAYLLYTERRRFESGGVLVVGPSAAYTAYIERVLPSLGEETVTLRSLGDVVDAVTATRLDPPEVARTKGSLRMRRVLAAAARDVIPGAPGELRVFVAGQAIRLGATELAAVRSQGLRHHQRNAALEAVTDLLAEAAWRTHRSGERDQFLDTFRDNGDVEAFVREWWRPLDAREVLLWLADRDRLGRYARGVLSADEVDGLARSYEEALETGTWSVADAALVDELASRLGPVPEQPREERGFYEVEELDDVTQYGVAALRAHGDAAVADAGPAGPSVAHDPRERLLLGRIGKPEEYAHILVDEAQDLSPMQWRMLGRRGRWASWTVVGDSAQASWPDLEEATSARDQAFGSGTRRLFHMDTNYRNAREIFDYAADVIRARVPDADIPQAVRETGVAPVDLTVGAGEVPDAVSSSAKELLDEVEGQVAVVTPARWVPALEDLGRHESGRVVLTDPMSTKGLEYDATVIVDPDAIIRESPGGVRVLYVALTRAAHRMTVLRVEP
ncbi:MAG TPA: AAA family ATPase [Segeticoccus sp.]|nr:AAA family ATPase [Segeticoccus sp.]